MLIYDFLHNGTKVTLVTRPRCFGKTLNMMMLAEFLDITKNSKEIFGQTKIMETDYASMINQWPTIFISFIEAKESTSRILTVIKNEIIREYQKYQKVFENMDEYDQHTYNSIKKALFSDGDNGLKIIDALPFLMKRMETYYGKKTMVIIDEYDTPFIEGYTHEFY